MIKKPAKIIARNRRHVSVRKTVSGSATRPRFSVFRSNTHIYAQLIDDVTGTTLCASSTLDKTLSGIDKTWNVEAAKMVGEDIGKKALELGIEEATFDRGGFLYHGRVKALAEGAREAGLKF